jgi:hypothetical protein
VLGEAYKLSFEVFHSNFDDLFPNLRLILSC